MQQWIFAVDIQESILSDVKFPLPLDSPLKLPSCPVSQKLLLVLVADPNMSENVNYSGLQFWGNGGPLSHPHQDLFESNPIQVPKRLDWKGLGVPLIVHPSSFKCVCVRKRKTETGRGESEIWEKQKEISLGGRNTLRKAGDYVLLMLLYPLCHSGEVKSLVKVWEPSKPLFRGMSLYRERKGPWLPF